MMYPYMTLYDGTEIVHSQIIEENDVQSNAHLLYKYAAEGGVQIA